MVYIDDSGFVTDTHVLTSVRTVLTLVSTSKVTV